uniref:Uncharacterized protein n=1 Tax=Lygus hesperus TaxID=30085 RepID=A0A0A9XJR8_LYGHE
MIDNTKRILQSTLQTLWEESKPLVTFLQDFPWKVERLPQMIREQVITKVPSTTGITDTTNQKIQATEIIQEKLKKSVTVAENNYTTIKVDIEKIGLQNDDPMLISLEEYRTSIDTCVAMLEKIPQLQNECIVREAIELAQGYIGKRMYLECLSLLDQVFEKFEDESALKETEEYSTLQSYHQDILKKLQDEKNKKVLLEHQRME